MVPHAMSALTLHAETFTPPPGQPPEESAIEPRGHVPRQLVAPLPPSQRTWRPKLTIQRVIVAFAFAGLAVLASWWAWVDLVGLIDLHGQNGHIVLVPLAIAILVWVRRQRIAYIRVGTRVLGPALAAVGVVSLLSGGSTGVSYLYHGGAVLVGLGAFVSVCGKGVVLRLLPVIAALALLLPVPGRVRDVIGPPLQEQTARIASGVLETTGFVAPARRDMSSSASAANAAERTPLPSLSLVPEARLKNACEGMPTTMLLAVVIYTYAFARPLRNRYRWLLLIAVIPLGLVANVIRATPLVWLLARNASGAPGADGLDVATQVGLYSEWLAVPLGLAAAAFAVRVLDWSGLHIYTFRLAR